MSSQPTADKVAHLALIYIVPPMLFHPRLTQLVAFLPGGSRNARVTWNADLKLKVLDQMKMFIDTSTVPGKKPCQEVVDAVPALREAGRDWRSVKYLVHNAIQSKSNKSKK